MGQERSRLNSLITLQTENILFNLTLNDSNTMIRPEFDHIHVINTLKELGNVLDLWTKTIIVDEISLAMRDVNKLSDNAKIEKIWKLFKCRNRAIEYTICNKICHKSLRH